jgi:anti-anti-sigma factor
MEERLVNPEYAIRKVGSVSVVDVSGPIVLGKTREALHDAIEGLLAKNECNILLNFSGATYIDSSGVGELVDSSAKVAERGAKLKVCSVPRRIRDLMRLSGITQLFEVFEDEVKAVTGFS